MEGSIEGAAREIRKGMEAVAASVICLSVSLSRGQKSPQYFRRAFQETLDLITLERSKER